MGDKIADDGVAYSNQNRIAWPLRCFPQPRASLAQTACFEYVRLSLWRSTSGPTGSLAWRCGGLVRCWTSGQAVESGRALAEVLRPMQTMSQGNLLLQLLYITGARVYAHPCAWVPSPTLLTVPDRQARGTVNKATRYE